MINTELKKKLLYDAQVLNPVAWVGKNGFTEEVKLEIKKQLKDKKLIKVKLLRGFLDENELDRKKFAEIVASDVGAELVKIIGFIAILYKNSSDKR